MPLRFLRRRNDTGHAQIAQSIRRMVFHIAVHILRIVFVVLQSRQRAD